MADPKSHASMAEGAEQKGHWPLPRETEARLSAALSIAKLGTFEWDLLSDSVTCDERSREIFGFGPTEGCTIGEVSARIHPHDLPRVQRESQSSRENLTRLETEYRIVLPNGVIRYVASITQPIPGDDNKAEHMFGVVSDVTERKQAEVVAREREEQLRSALEIDTVGVISFDLEGKITQANDAFLRMAGYTREDLDGGLLRWDILTPVEW